MRDYLYECGPSSPTALAAACGVTVTEVLRGLDSGVFQPSSQAHAAERCVRCAALARTNDLCDDCRGGIGTGGELRPRASIAPVRAMRPADGGEGFRSRARAAR